MSYLADDTAAIRARMEELKAERQLALTGSSAPVEEAKTEAKTEGWAAYMMGHDYDPA